MTDVSPLHRWLLRGVYLLLVFGLGPLIWPALLDPARQWELQHGTVYAMLGALSLLGLLGLRYPVQMLPLLLFELAWKTIWLALIVRPLWVAGTLDAATRSNAQDCLLVVIVYAAIPWRYVWHHYILRPAEPWGWRRQSGRATATRM